MLRTVLDLTPAAQRKREVALESRKARARVQRAQIKAMLTGKPVKVAQPVRVGRQRHIVEHPTTSSVSAMMAMPPAPFVQEERAED